MTSQLPTLGAGISHTLMGYRPKSFFLTGLAFLPGYQHQLNTWGNPVATHQLVAMPSVSVKQSINQCANTTRQQQQQKATTATIATFFLHHTPAVRQDVACIAKHRQRRASRVGRRSAGNPVLYLQHCRQLFHIQLLHETWAGMAANMAACPKMPVLHKQSTLDNSITAAKTDTSSCPPDSTSCQRITTSNSQLLLQLLRHVASASLATGTALQQPDAIAPDCHLITLNELMLNLYAGGSPISGPEELPQLLLQLQLQRCRCLVWVCRAQLVSGPCPVPPWPAAIRDT